MINDIGLFFQSCYLLEIQSVVFTNEINDMMPEIIFEIIRIKKQEYI